MDTERNGDEIKHERVSEVPPPRVSAMAWGPSVMVTVMVTVMVRYPPLVVIDIIIITRKFGGLFAIIESSMREIEWQ